jgi:hypothetical protein
VGLAVIFNFAERSILRLSARLGKSNLWFIRFTV